MSELNPHGKALPVSKPGPGVAGKTGTWRVMRPVYEPSKCVRCRLCWLYCPENVIDLNEGDNHFIKIDYDYCKGCGICSSVCPTGAIKMVPEGGR